MQDAILVTVICSCYNHSEFVTESIQSVLNQSYKNIQLIVVDDCSNDNSVSVIENFIVDFPEIIFFISETAPGPPHPVSKPHPDFGFGSGFGFGFGFGVGEACFVFRVQRKALRALSPCRVATCYAMTGDSDESGRHHPRQQAR